MHKPFPATVPAMISLRIRCPASLAMAGLLVLGGCAVHAPISETVMLQYPAMRHAHDGRIGVGFAGTYAPARGIAQDLATQEFPESSYRADDLPWNPNRISAGLYLVSVDPDGHYAVSGTVGFPVSGLDVTWRLRRGNYVTAALSAPGQIQVYLQHRLVNSLSLGSAAGVGYRSDLYAFHLPGHTIFGRLEHVALHSFGARGTLLYRAREDPKGGIRMSVYAGYAPRIGQPILDLTLSLGRF